MQNQCRPTTARAVTIVRAHRIHINEIPALFSEGSEPEPERLERGSFWRTASLGLSFRQLIRQSLRFLLPPQAGNEKSVRGAAIGRQTHAQTHT
jgi:hypothetical protein